MSPTITNDLAAYSYYVFKIETIHAHQLKPNCYRDVKRYSSNQWFRTL